MVSTLKRLYMIFIDLINLIVLIKLRKKNVHQRERENGREKMGTISEQLNISAASLGILKIY